MSSRRCFILAITLVGLGFITGCATLSRGATATKNWFYGVGDTLPVSDDRCDNTFFCFGRNAGETWSQSMMPRRVPMENREGFAAYEPSPSPRFMPPPVGAEPAFARARVYPPPTPPFPLPPEMMERPPMPSMPPGAMSGDMPPLPPDLFEQKQREAEEYSKLVRQERMKPWEMNPEWEKDLEPTPFDTIERQVSW